MSSAEPSEDSESDGHANDAWLAIADEAGVSDCSSSEGEDHGFGRYCDTEFGDFENKVFNLWEAQEDKEPTDPYRVLNVKPSDLREKFDNSLASKLQASGPGEVGVARLLKLRLRRAHTLVKDPRRLRDFRNMGDRDDLKLAEKWAKVKYSNGHYEGGVERLVQPEGHFGRKGKGITKITGGETYEGCYQQDKRHGIGIQFWKNGDVYIGEWKSDQMHGQGVYYYSTGATYMGPFMEGFRQGRGRLQWSNGTFYIGSFKADSRTGRGFLKQPGRRKAPGFRYMGEWLEGQKHGTGRYLGDKEGYYKGQFSSDEFHGDGHLNLHNGNVYAGQFVCGRPQGEGSYLWGESGNSYTGTFWRGFRDGKGEQIYQEKTMAYNGEWRLNEATGEGLVSFQNGDEYEGEVQDGEFQGQGSYKWATTSSYVGSFNEGLRQGPGTLDFAEGGTHEGLFWEDLRHGRARIKNIFGEPAEEKWHFGSLVERGPDRLVSNVDPEHVVAIEPKVDDIQTWNKFMTSNGHADLPEAEQETHQKQEDAQSDGLSQLFSASSSPRISRQVSQ